jgi:hypothetical protein
LDQAHHGCLLAPNGRRAGLGLSQPRGKRASRSTKIDWAALVYTAVSKFGYIDIMSVLALRRNDELLRPLHSQPTFVGANQYLGNWKIR